MPAPYLLTAEPWVPVWDLDASAARDVGLTEALTRAHRLLLPVTRAEDVPVLRLLVALFDAAAQPRDAAEWDAAWKAETLDTTAVTTYLDRWAERLDLFHPNHPVFQCGHLTEYARGPEALHPGSLGGDAGAWFNHELYRPLPPYPAARAAQLLLHLLAYDVAGVKRAVPGDPAAKNGKVYGSQIGPFASSTHCHLTTDSGTLKDVLLLNLPPQPRATDDAPVWERDTPPAPMRTRTPTGRLDLLTWPNRRIRLHATEDGSVDAVAHHDGDRLPGGWLTTKQLDPMTAWSTTKAGGPAPLEFLDLHGWPQPWRGAFLLSDAPQHSAVVQHAIAAAERGTLAPNSTLRAVLSTAVHANQHRATLSAIPIATTPLGTAGELADPQARDGLATMARYAAAIARNLRLQTVKVSGRPSAQVAPRVQLDNLDDAWTDAVHTHAQDPAQARAQWQAAIEAAAERRIEEFPLSPMQRGQLLSLYRENPEPKEKPTRRRPPAKPARARTAQRGPAAATYEVFDGTYTLSQLSKHPDCVVSYPTLRARVDSGWDVTEAATTPSGRGPRRSR